ncbi:MAG: hypothetical protein U5K79_10935 [Cyclobacteriaceae bacterium]|nr:hypothetical protein [Cyclobacteriaceae bacterium]
MTAIDLKTALIHRIAEIDDISFLQAIKTILDSKTNSEVLTLTAKERDDIMASKKELENGLFIESKDLDKEIQEWLSEK